MRTNNKQVREQIKKHILECVLDYNENNFTDIKECCNFIYSEFQRVANYKYNIIRFPNEQQRFSDYLNGLPFGFYYYYDDVKDYLNSLGINPENKYYDSEKSLDLYHYLIYSEVIKNKTL